MPRISRSAFTVIYATNSDRGVGVSTLPDMASTHVLCPGQGAQVVGMGRDYFEKSPEAKPVFEQANDILGVDLTQLCFEGPEATLDQTDVAQPAIFVTSLACHAAAKAAGKIDPSDVATIGGLSLGEYTALHLAGVFDFETGLKLVQARGRYMQEAATSVPGGMVSLLGGDEAGVVELCELARGDHVLQPANYNCPGQIVISGALPACEKAAAMASDKGFRAIPLKVAGAFHSPLMKPGADRLAEDMENIEFKAPTMKVWSNVTADLHGDDPAEIKKLLIRQITEPVKWSQTVQKMVEQGGKFVELAPGRVLAGLLKKVDRRADMLNLGSADALA